MEETKKVEMITLKGTKEGTVVELDRRRHVLLSDGYYEKTDVRNVVQVNGSYFRRNSPLITKLSTNLYGQDYFALTKETDCTFDGEVCLIKDIRKSNYMVFSSDGTHFIESLSTFVGTTDTNHHYFKENDGNSSIILKLAQLAHVSGKYTRAPNIDFRKYGLVYLQYPKIGIFHISDCVQLHNSYGNNNLVPKFYSEKLALIDGAYHKVEHIKYTLDSEFNKYKPIENIGTKFRFGDRKTVQSSVLLTKMTKLDLISSALFDKFLDGGQLSKQEKETLSILINGYLSNFSKHVRTYDIDEDFKDSVIKTEFGISVSKKEDAEYLSRLYEFIHSDYYIGSQVMPYVVTSNKGSWFKGLDRQDQLPIFINNQNIGDTGGDFVWFKPEKHEKGPIKVSTMVNETGGIGYTFGLEVETSYGHLPKQVCRDLGISAVGDRSIGMLEYVTPPLHGNNGIEEVNILLSTLQKYTLTDDRCGIHVHVGGADGVETPWFSRMFSTMAILLGAQVEKELFSLLPDNRMSKTNSAGESYCGSILSYEDSLKNLLEKGVPRLDAYKTILSTYVMGSNTDHFKVSEFVGNHVPDNRGIELGRWAHSRYKWLNLINCNTDNSNRRGGGGFKTIEFRAFNGTLNKDDVKWFILFSLAFTRFAHKNKHKVENGGNTIKDIILFSVSDLATQEFMMSWIEERKSIIKKARKLNTTK